MKRNLSNFVETESRDWKVVKFLIFAITIQAPMLLFSLQSGRVVWPLFFLFPVGLFYFFKSPFLLPNLVLGWSVYITITIIGTKSKNPRIFILMYVLIIGLVAINLKGCAAMMADPSTTTW